jgi:hypothetical protein
MSVEDLKPGIYVLTETVENPHSDGRRSVWFWAKSFPAGMTFVVTPDFEYPECRLIAPYPVRHATRLVVNPKRTTKRNEIAKLIAAKLEDKGVENLRELLSVKDVSANYALSALVKQGVVTFGQIKSVLENL